MIHSLKNVTLNTISLGGSLNIAPDAEIVIYNDVTLEIHPYIDVIINSSELSYVTADNNLNYNISYSRIFYYQDSVYTTSTYFYSWFNDFKQKYAYYKHYKSSGIVNVKLDVINNNLIFDNRTLLISDLPNNIPATKIANGSISNAEFETLNGINTSVTVQAQIDGKANTVHNHSYLFFLSTPSLSWTLNHGLGVKPVVEIRNLSQEIVNATVTHTNDNTVFIVFSKSMQVYANLTI